MGGGEEILEKLCKEYMIVWSGNPAALLTPWAKTTTADSDPEKAGSRGCASMPGFGLGRTELRHSFLDSLQATSTKSHPPTLGIVAASAALGRLWVR